MADPRLATVVASSRARDAVSLRKTDLLCKRQLEILRRILTGFNLLLSPKVTCPAVGVEEDDAEYHALAADGRKRGLDMTSVFN